MDKGATWDDRIAALEEWLGGEAPRPPQGVFDGLSPDEAADLLQEWRRRRVEAAYADWTKSTGGTTYSARHPRRGGA